MNTYAPSHRRRISPIMFIYRFAIRSGDDWEALGCTDLPDDHAARAFGNDVISDMLGDSAVQYAGWTMDITEGGRAVCSIAFASAFEAACEPPNAGAAGLPAALSP
jgi:hypothetical protein